ncbi:hypothetical protein Tco_0824366 [Tanacetum coccineum]|uniref:Uncharacterized protein n=1 Tax=Tanacetum coccineum TaxID=301880 RepID=A0ABQ5AN78_9ASTR
MLISSSAQPSEVPFEQQPDPSPRPSPRPSPKPSPTPIVTDSIPEPTDQAKEIKLLKAKITKLKMQAKPVIKHHKAYLKSVSLQQRFPRKSFSKKHRVHKESVSKQGRKKAKGESAFKRSLFDLSTEDVVSTDKEGVSTDFEKVSTDRPIVSTDGSKVSTDEQLMELEEREQFTIEERAKFLHDTIAAQRKFLAQQRSEAIRNRPPTKNQFIES